LRVAFLFPGQGSDVARVGEELAEGVPAVERLLTEALKRLEMDRGVLWARGGRALERTAVLQPVLTALTLGVHQALAAGNCEPDLVAGHSLGEIAAWAAVGGLTPPEAIDLAFHRGRVMEEAARSHAGGMAALRVRSEEELDTALARGRQHGQVELAARNAPDEWVVAGDDEALRAIAALSPSTRLPVSGAWHGSRMIHAAEEWGAILERRGEAAAPRSPGGAARSSFLSNRTGAVVEDPSDIPRLLVESFTHPVRWTEVMQSLAEEGVTDLVTLGPGKILRGLARRNGLGACRFHATDSLSNLRRTMEHL
jgi:[acyl-carrier-protein] S-malonyltransferase